MWLYPNEEDKMAMERESSIQKLVGLYQQARSVGDRNSILHAEAAMASFLDAEAAVSRMYAAEAMVAQLGAAK